MARIGFASTALVGVFVLVFALAAWHTGDGLAIGVATPIVAGCALCVLAVVWLIVLIVRAARDYLAEPPRG